MNRRVRIIAASTLLALAPLGALGGTTAPGQSWVTSRLAASFTNLAGSRENATALVTALQTALLLGLSIACVIGVVQLGWRAFNLLRNRPESSVPGFTTCA